MISICESYARDYHITFNPAKSKCFNASSSEIELRSLFNIKYEELAT